MAQGSVQTGSVQTGWAVQSPNGEVTVFNEYWHAARTAEDVAGSKVFYARVTVEFVKEVTDV